MNRMPRRLSTLPTNQRGVALAIVIWFIAGMSLLVSGIVAQARVDTQLAQLHLSRAKVAAAGDGAINLALLDRVRQGGTRGDRDRGKEYRIGDIGVAVELVSTSGLLDLNEATAEQLTVLFTAAANIPNSDARYLAANVIKWRSGRGGKSAASNNKKAPATGPDGIRCPRGSIAGGGFYPQCSGCGQGLRCGGQAGARGFNMADAPPYVRQALSRAFSGQSARNPGEQDSGGLSGAYRVDAVVLYGDTRWLRRRWVITGSSENSSLPWQVVRTEPARVDERRNNEFR